MGIAESHISPDDDDDDEHGLPEPTNEVQRICVNRLRRDVAFLCAWHKRAGSKSFATRACVDNHIGHASSARFGRSTSQ
jgi:hypothetical protein